MWVRESHHNYEDNARLSEHFVCPSALRFVVEFDPRCETETRCVCVCVCVRKRSVYSVECFIKMVCVCVMVSALLRWCVCNGECFIKMVCVCV